MEGSVAKTGIDPAKGGGCVVFAWPDFEPDNLFAGLTVTRLAVAEALAARGRRVVMAWAGRPGVGGESQLRQWVEARQGAPITVESVPRACRMNHPWRFRWERAFDFHDWLRDFVRKAPVATVDFPDGGGVAYYSLLAKRGGLDFGAVRFVIEASGPLRRVRAIGHRAIDNLEDLYSDFLERRCIEMADAMVAPDASVPAWLAGHGWELPAGVSVIEPTVGPVRGVPPAKRVSRLVIVAPLGEEGRLPECSRALGLREIQEKLTGKQVIFWGPDGRIRDWSGSKFLERGGAPWPFRWQVEKDLSARAAKRLFGDGEGAAIFPAGRTVAWLAYQWCRQAGVSCVEPRREPTEADDKSGHRQMDAADLRMLEVVPNPEAMENAFDEVFGGTAVSPRSSAAGSRERTVAREDILLESCAPPGSLAGDDAPLVSVCIVTRNRSRMLAQALASIEAQDYPAIEIVLVDDGSTFKAALAFLDEIEPRFRDRGWKLLRQGRAFHAAARNRAVSEARGDWIMLFDDDCVSEPNRVRRMLTFARNIGADIVTCPRHVFVGEEAPFVGDRSGQVWVPLGAVSSAGLFENCMGDTNLMARRETFFALGGLRADFGVPAADREFLVRAASAGCRVEVIPEVLYHYRVTPESVSRGLTPEGENLKELRFARAFVEALPRPLADVPRIAAEWMHRHDLAERALARSEARIAKLEARLARGPGRSRWEIRIRLDGRSMLDWCARLMRSIRKRLPGGTG